MAKKRRLNQRPARGGKSPDAAFRKVAGTVAAPSTDSAAIGVGTASVMSGTENVSWLRSIDPMNYALAMLAGAIVYLAYHPSDSVAVEQGDALWFAVLALVVATLTWATWFWNGADRQVGVLGEAGGHRAESGNRVSGLAGWLLDWIPWAMALWMMLAAFATSPPGNLRMATNEAWLWVSAVAIFTASRLLLMRLGTRRSLVALLVVCTMGLAVHGLHQYFVSLPANRLHFEQDPEQVLAIAGINAPPGSSERMVFANRLMDGGPTATFALANSLAAVLLLGVVLSVGVLRFRFRRLGPWGIALWLMITLLCVGCLMATRSRSATLAMLISVALLWLSAGRLGRFRFRTVAIGLSGLVVLSVAGAVFLACFGNREWFEQAPASLAFRFQYWRSTWQMVLEYPLFGVGPGNFQSLYERFRELSATEQIAEPHNLFFETLASGGFVALLMLVSMLVAGLLVGMGRKTSAVTQSASTVEPGGDPWVLLGGSAAFLLIWLVGLASRYPPDLEASFFVVPVVVIAAFVIWPSIRQMRSEEIDAMVAVGIMGVGIHLMVSGGWTVPGVGVLLWIGAGWLTRRVEGTTDSGIPASSPAAVGSWGWSGRPCSVAVVMVGLVGLMLLTHFSLQPVEQRKRLMAKVGNTMQGSRPEAARADLLAAADADPWSPAAMLWLANLYQRELIAQGDSQAARLAWQQALQEALRRAGDDPAVYRAVAGQQIHLYQRLGRDSDLQAATALFGKVAIWSPADEWVMAQMSVLEAAQGQNDKAAEYARKASELSSLGGNIERALSRQLIYLPENVGQPARWAPVRRPADQLLGEQILAEPNQVQ